MSWSLSASGHAANERDEALLIEELGDVLTMPGAGTAAAMLYTQHHGQLNLLEPRDDEADPGPVPPTA